MMEPSVVLFIGDDGSLGQTFLVHSEDETRKAIRQLMNNLNYTTTDREVQTIYERLEQTLSCDVKHGTIYFGGLETP